MSKVYNLVGQVFGRLTVISKAPSRKGHGMWNCKCSCGNYTTVETYSLVKGGTQSCGCLQRERTSSATRIDLSGNKFGKLTAIKPIGKKDNYIIWECRCDCGNECSVTQYRLESGETRSCGCLARETAHDRRIYTTDAELDLSRRYDNMVSRCYNPNVRSYTDYGDRGIYICDEWKNNRQSFIKWALANGYSPDLTIDRIDNNGPYCPSNCRFVTMQQQCENRRTNVFITVGGVTCTVTEWERRTGVNHEKLSKLYKENPRVAEELISKNLHKVHE